MTFSVKIKNELAKKTFGSRHCNIAELSAFVNMSSKFYSGHIVFSFEQKNIALRLYHLIKKLFGKYPEVRISSCRGHINYKILIVDKDLIEKVKASVNNEKDKINQIVVQSKCCKRAFIRVSFLTRGTISNPSRNYSMEFLFKDQKFAKDFIILLEAFDIFGKIIARQKYYIVYIKDSSQIVDVLNVAGAHGGLLEYETSRVEKNVRNNINRKVNCEVANLRRVINASVKQEEDIELIAKTIGLDSLDENLAEVAVIRRDNPYATLAQISEMLNRKISKSGVNHRLKKISNIAEGIRIERRKSNEGKSGKG